MKLAALVLLAAAVFAAPALADPPQSWNGTWIGNWKDGNGTQIVFAGNTFISIYWDGDYVSDADADTSDGRPVVKIHWTGGSAVVTRDGLETAHVAISEKGKPAISFPLKRDNN
jgi:hypothetical protein